MEYLTKRNLSKNTVIFDSGQSFKSTTAISQKRELEIDNLIMKQLKPELNKIKTGRNSSNSKK